MERSTASQYRMNQQHPIAELLTELARGIIDHPEALVVQGKELSGSLLLHARAHTADHGKLLGTHGATYNAILAILCAAGDRNGKQVRLQLLNPVVGRPEPQPRFAPQARWDSPGLLHILRVACVNLFGHHPDLNLYDFEDSTIVEVVMPQGQELPKQELKEALDKVFNVIGKAKGRVVNVDIVKGK